MKSHLIARVAGALGILATAGAAAAAQDTALTRSLLANRHPLSIINGRLGGTGGRLLVNEGRNARFFLVGEEHGIAQTPQVVQALLRELRPAGYNTFAIEISPLQGARLDALARQPGARDALNALMGPWYSTIPFYSVAEEHGLLEFAMTRQDALPPMRIWGLDYDISADRLFLAELEGLAPPAGKPAVRRARDLADSGFVAIARDKNPSKLFAWSAPDSVFDALRAAFGGYPPPRAAAIIDLFERSARINRLFLGGDGYASNLMRSAFLRENLAKALAAAPHGGPTPRVLFKFGGSHVMRGFNATHALDLGTAAAVAAEAHGERAFNVLILGGSGGQAARMNIMSMQYEPARSSEVDAGSLAWLRPAVPDSGWVLFDLRAIRAEYVGRRGSSLTAMQDRVLHGYDAIVVLTGSTPGTPAPLTVR